jgi:coproporphyrinogen III oxidase
MNNKNIYDFLQNLQQQIIEQLEAIDGKKFKQDKWEKDNSRQQTLRGHGCTAILENGNTFERAGIGFSCVNGDELPKSASIEREHLAGCKFDAIGVSVIVHPRNPFIPTVHFNIRALVVHTKEDVWWFGGGMDLTPYYAQADDCIHFHKTCKQALDPFGAELYPRFKRQCDEYFYLKHRQEARGIGGIFYDNFDDLGFEQSFAMTKTVGNAFLQAYIPIVNNNIMRKYTDEHREFQAFRRGRYVEFNLIFDRGTLFGLQSGGRTESILMSMPPVVKWCYNYEDNITSGSEEHKLYTDFLPAQKWI